MSGSAVECDVFGGRAGMTVDEGRDLGGSVHIRQQRSQLENRMHRATDMMLDGKLQENRCGR